MHLKKPDDIIAKCLESECKLKDNCLRWVYRDLLNKRIAAYATEKCFFYWPINEAPKETEDE